MVNKDVYIIVDYHFLTELPCALPFVLTVYEEVSTRNKEGMF